MFLGENAKSQVSMGRPARDAIAERSCDVLLEFLNTLYLSSASSRAHIDAMSTPSSFRPENLRAYLPPRPKAYAAAITCGEPATVEDDLVGSLHRFYALVVFAEAETSAIANDPTGDRANLSCRLQSASAYWRTAALVGGTILLNLEASKHRAVLSTWYERVGDVKRLVSSLDTVETRDPAAQDAVTIPGWVERRSAVRKLIDCQIMLAFGNSLQRALVQDASEFGIGIWGARDAERGMKVSILWGPGRAIEGRIAWVEGLRAGIELDSKLPSWFIHSDTHQPN